jgi:hypothetical protein
LTVGDSGFDSETAGVIGLRRYVNDSVYKAACKYDGGHDLTYRFFCECGEARCHRLIELRLSEYASRAVGSVVNQAL